MQSHHEITIIKVIRKMFSTVLARELVVRDTRIKKFIFVVDSHIFILPIIKKILLSIFAKTNKFHLNQSLDVTNCTRRLCILPLIESIKCVKRKMLQTVKKGLI